MRGRPRLDGGAREQEHDSRLYEHLLLESDFGDMVEGEDRGSESTLRRNDGGEGKQDGGYLKVWRREAKRMYPKGVGDGTKYLIRALAFMFMARAR